MDRITASQSIERVMMVIDLVAEHGKGGCRLSDVVAGTPLGKATAHRFLRDLVAVGLLDYDAESGRYFLGIRLVALGEAAANRYGVASLARNILDELAAETDDTIYLTLRSGDDANCIARVEGSYPVKILTLKIGDRRPLGVGAGPLAILMACEASERAAILNRNAPRYQDFGLNPAAVEEMLKDSLARGYALNLGRMVPDMAGLGVPLRDQSGQVFGALSIAAVASRMQPERLEALKLRLSRAAKDIEEVAGPLLGRGIPGERRLKVLQG